MSKIRRFIPRTRQQVERLLQIVQQTFIGGVYNDIPASQIPQTIKRGVSYPTGLFYAINAIPYTHGIEGRQGNKLLNGTSQALLPALGTNIHASKTSNLITMTGYTLSDSDIGRFFNWRDGSRDVVVDVDTGSNIATSLSYDDHSATTIGRIEGDIKAKRWHPIIQKWIIQIDTRIFISDSWKISAWTEVVMNAKYAPSESKGLIKIFKKDAVLFNSTGIYKIVLYNTDTPYYYQINVPLPAAFGDLEDQGTSVYGRRYLYSYSKLNNAAQTLNRVSDGVVVEHEGGTNPTRKSGTTDITDKAKYIDWQVGWLADAFGSNEPYVLTLEPPDESAGASGRHFTHYSPRGTLDVGVNGTDPSVGSGTNIERYWWMDDVPLVKAFTFTRDAGGGYATVENKIFSKYDNAAEISYCNSGDHLVSDTIESVIDANYALGTFVYSPAAQTAGCIGADHVTLATKSGYTVSRYGIHGSRPSTDDIGKLLFWADGDIDIITGVTVGSVAFYDQITVAKSGSKAVQGVAWNPVSRTYADFNSDDDLQVRNKYLLKNRFFRPMPNCNSGEIAPGFLFGIIDGTTDLYYCDTADESLIGYYNEGHQIDTLNDAIICLSAFDGILIGYGANGWSKWDIKNILTMDNTNAGAADIGEQPISVITTRSDVAGIGILDRSSFVKTKDGIDLVITQHRELRTHNGTAFSASLSADRIQKKLNKLQAVSAMHYDEISGLLIYGTENSAS